MTDGATAATDTGIITKVSALTVPDTAARFTGIISAKGLRLFDVIDQRAEARQAGLDMPDTVPRSAGKSDVERSWSGKLQKVLLIMGKMHPLE